MLRISIKKEKNKTIVLYLEGKICQQWIGELHTEITRSLEGGMKVCLDFSKVSYLDEEAAKMIEQFPPHRIEKRNGSLFIRSMLDI